LRALRLTARGGERLPVIILSADATPVAKREALEAGADAFLHKPIEALRLLEEIQTLCPASSVEARRAAPVVAPRAERPGEAVVVNVETLEHLSELGSSRGFVDKLIKVFLADNTTLLGRLEEALAARKYGEFRSLMHAAKGSSASMGTDRLTQLCDRLGKLSDREMRMQSPGLLRMVSDEFAAARTQLEHYAREKQSSAS
jgi:two-component system sensor histidine kinase RpfC